MRNHTTSCSLALALVLAATLTACSTAYQDARSSSLVKNPGGGYDEERGPGGLIKVRYAGNQAILMYQVQHYALYRCAEIAQREGSPYFALYQTLADALQDRRAGTVRPTTLLGIPHAEVYIKLHPAAGPGLLSTAQTLANLKPIVFKDPT